MLVNLSGLKMGTKRDHSSPQFCIADEGTRRGEFTYIHLRHCKGGRGKEGWLLIKAWLTRATLAESALKCTLFIIPNNASPQVKREHLRRSRAQL